MKSGINGYTGKNNRIDNIYDSISRVDKITEFVRRHNLEPYRQDQILSGLYKRGVGDFTDLAPLPNVLRELLSKEIGDTNSLHAVKTIKESGTERVLFNTHDNNPAESVFMTYPGHTSLCLSCQSGCPLGCKFCATGAMGFKANLSTDEICDQVLYYIQNARRPDNLVFMGMGEPFLNDNIFNALNAMTHPNVFGYSQRKISVSTVGIIPGIKKLGTEYPQVNLAWSLHTPFNEQRLELMPITKVYPVREVMRAISEHVNKTHRRVFISYVMLENINDSDEHAKELASLVRTAGKNAYLLNVNIIKFHSVRNSGFKSSPPDKIIRFSNILKRLGVSCTIRKSFGEEIQAACGQLSGTDN